MRYLSVNAGFSLMSRFWQFRFHVDRSRPKQIHIQWDLGFISGWAWIIWVGGAR